MIVACIMADKVEIKPEKTTSVDVNDEDDIITISLDETEPKAKFEAPAAAVAGKPAEEAGERFAGRGRGSDAPSLAGGLL